RGSSPPPHRLPRVPECGGYRPVRGGCARAAGAADGLREWDAYAGDFRHLPGLPKKAGGRGFVRALAVALLAAAILTTVAKGGGGLAPAGVRAAADYAAGHRGISLLVIQGGHVVFEEYKDGSRSTAKIYSGTKAFWCMAALAAQEDGILDLD